MEITRELIQEAVENAFNEVMAVKNDIDNSDEIVSSFDTELRDNKVLDQDTVPANNAIFDQQPANISDNLVATPMQPVVEEPVVEEPVVEEPVVEEPVVEEPVVEEVKVTECIDEKIDESIDDSGDYTLFGIDINVTKNEDKYTITLSSKKDNTEKVVETESANLNIVLGLVEDFFNELVMSECDEDSAETDETINEDENEKTEELSEETNVKDENEDEEHIFDENDDDDDDEDDEDDEDKKDREVLSFLRLKYSDNADAIFAQGIKAKKLALDLVKEKILATTIKELSAKNEEAQTLLACKKEQLEKVSMDYLVSTKLNHQFNIVRAVISNSIKELKTGVDQGLINETLIKTTINRYNSLLSSVIDSRDINIISAAINNINKISSVILAHKKAAEQKRALLSNTKPTINSTDTKVSAIKVRPILRPKNVLNNDGYTENTTILAGTTKYQTEYDEMIAEIIDIGNN